MTFAPNADNVVERGWAVQLGLSGTAAGVGAGAILAHRFVSPTTTAVGQMPQLVQAALGDNYIVGLNSRNAAVATGETFHYVTEGLGLATADDAITFGHPIKGGYQGRAIEFVDATLSGSTILAATAGGNAANQPANDIVQVVSSSAGDTTQTVTLIGTTTGTNTIVVQTVALNGTTAVDSVKSDWGIVVAVKLSASCAGTITIRKKTGPATVTTITTGNLSAGVTVLSPTVQAYYQFPTVVASGASTKQAAFQGTDSTGATVYDSIPLNGTTAATFAVVSPKRVTEVYLLDVASATNVTMKVGATEAANKKIARANGQASVQGDLIPVLMSL